MPGSPGELLELLLEEGPLDLDELKEFVAKSPREGLFHDYKSGALLDDLKKARLTVRRWVTGFANAEGGVLILGFDETKPSRQLIACVDRIGAEDLRTWAAKALTGLEGFFSPAPRFRCIPTGPGRTLLLIAVARAPQLVPCHDAGVTRYYLRFEDMTPEVPAYLISDLVLGRRRHPVFSVDFEEVRFRYETPVDGFFALFGEISFNLIVENASLVTADNVDIGLIAWTCHEGDLAPISAHLRAYLDVQPPTVPGEPLSWKVARLSNKTVGLSGQTLAPFDTLPLRFGAFRVPRYRAAVATVARPPDPIMAFSCALYVLPAGSPPTWFQVDLTVADLPVSWTHRRMTLPKSYLQTRRLLSERPVIAWREK